MKTKKGIVLAGGSGTRLHPATLSVSKQLLPIYDKPMIYYSISVLMLAGIREILLISSEQHMPLYKELFGNGSSLGISLDYAVQHQPNGIAEALIIGETFINNDKVALILGDNIFYGQGFTEILQKASHSDGATIFGYQVNDPKRFGIVEFDKKMSILSIEEKPSSPKSNHAIVGLYFYDNRAVEFAKSITPSSRGELEITELNEIYLRNGQLNLSILGRGFAWFDTGTSDSLLDASMFVQTIEKRQGIKIACLEEIALNHGWIKKTNLNQEIFKSSNSEYYKYLKSLENNE